MELDPKNRIREMAIVAWRAAEGAITSGVTREEAEKTSDSPFHDFTRSLLAIYQYGLEDGGRMAIDMYTNEIRERAEAARGESE